MIRINPKISEKLFVALCVTVIALPLILLIVLIGDVAIKASERISWHFLTSFPSMKAEEAGIYSALVGSFYIIVLTGAVSLPVGVGAAIYLEEYAKKNLLTNLIEINIANLAGVPSIIYGLLGLGIFVHMLNLGRSLLAGGLTLALLVLPIVIMASREALRTVPPSLREASLALGATRWETIRQVVLPMAIPGILTGSILSISRAIGETAPLIPVGAVAYMAFLPDSLRDPFTVLPIQIFNWVSRPQEEFTLNAAAGIAVLLVVLLTINAGAIVLRDRYQKRTR
ncbi:MAG TPA: phosphate ABC transporter permease PstA [bacterium]|jgi:phosphate transport system permease protein